MHKCSQAEGYAQGYAQGYESCHKVGCIPAQELAHFQDEQREAEERVQINLQATTVCSAEVTRSTHPKLPLHVLLKKEAMDSCPRSVDVLTAETIKKEFSNERMPYPMSMLL